MSILDKKGISVTSGFKLVSGQPLDARNVVDDLTGLQDLVNNGAAYEGIVVYVKSEQQLKQYNGSEWNNVYPEGDIITVNELPNVANAELDKIYRVPKLITSGTTLPNTGTVENICFNTTLSISEVEDILNELTFTGEAYLALAASDESPIIVVYKHTDPEGMLIRSESGSGVLWANEGAVQNYASTYGITHAGWQEFTNPIVLNEEVKATAGGASVGTQNGLLSNLIYTAPYTSTIVGYTYHRANGNEWLDILNGGSGGGSSSDSSDFIDVEELPLAKVGTSVPSSGTIDKVYINTSLSDEEILEILKSIELVNIPDMGTVYMVTASADMTNGIGFLGYQDEGLYYFSVTVNGQSTVIWNTSDGWVNKMSTIVAGYDTVLSLLLGQLGGTVQNDKLKNLISATPFELNSEIDLSKIYRVAEYDWVGTEVPSSGTIDKVYINTSLNNEQVLEILQSVDLINVPDSPFPIYAIVCTADLSSALTIMNITSTNVYYLTLTTSGTSTSIWKSDTGWENASSSLTIGYENVMSVVASQLGATVQNDKITKFISSTPFTRTGDLLGYKYYRIINGEWAAVLGEADLSEIYKELATKVTIEEVNEAIQAYMTSNYGNGDTEEF